MDPYDNFDRTNPVPPRWPIIYLDPFALMLLRQQLADTYEQAQDLATLERMWRLPAKDGHDHT